MKKLPVVRTVSSFAAAGLLLVHSLALLPLGLSQAQAFDGSGSGTPSSHYLVSSCTDLQSIDSGSASEGAIYELTGDITCSASSGWNSGSGFKPIDDFQGTLDGKGHKIIGLHINRPSEDGIGLFSQLSQGGLVTNLEIDDTSTIVGRYDVGAIAGYAYYSKLLGVKSSADVTGDQIAGGLVGDFTSYDEEAVIQQSSFYGTVSAPNGSAGGIAGATNNGWRIEDVVSDGSVAGLIAGGIMGTFANSCGNRLLNHAVVYSDVSGSAYQGGIGGQVINISCPADVMESVSYATLSGTGGSGGVFGALNSASVNDTNVFFDQTAAGTTDCFSQNISSNSPTCADISTNVPPNDAPFDDFDFTNIWQTGSQLTLRAFDGTTLSSPTVPTTVTTTLGENGDGLDSTVMELSWGAPEHPGSTPIRQYRYQVKESSQSWDNTVDNETVNSTDPVNIDNLRLGVTYDVRVQAYNTYSGSGWATVQYSPGAAPSVTVHDCAELGALDDTTTDNRFANIELAKDIDCTGVDFQPIGSSDVWNDNSFEGTINGHGHTISNLNISFDNWGAGLFEYTDGASFQNIKIENATIQGQGSSGALIGDSVNTSLQNIYVNANVQTSDNEIGGMVGYAEYYGGRSFTLDNLHSNSTVVGSDEVGTIFGEIDVEDPGTQVTLSRSVGEGTINGDNNYAGGLIGYTYVENEENDSQPDTRLTVSDSYSMADVSGSNDVGGLIGYAENYNDGYDSIAETLIEYSYFGGTVNATGDSAGGLVGYVEQLSDAKDFLTLTNDFVSGPVAGNTSAYALLGNSGYADSNGTLFMDNVYYDATATDQSDALYDPSFNGWNVVNSDPQAFDYDANYFKNNNTNAPLDSWDFDETWSTQADGFPILQATINVDPTPDDQVGSDSVDLTSAQNGAAIHLAQSGCSAISSAASNKESGLAVQDPGFDYPVGLVSYTLTGCNLGVATVTVTIAGNFDLSKVDVRKYNTANNTYTSLKGNEDMSVTASTLGGKPAITVTLNINDGGSLDQDGQVNGTIVDPLGIGVQAVGAPNTGFAQD